MTNKKQLLNLCLLLLCLPVFGQVNMGYRSWDGIPVIVGGDTLKNAWAGGFKAPQFSDVDLNNDGRKDLFVFDRQGATVSIFINEGTNGQMAYKHAPDLERKFPRLEHFVLFEDYNCDGKEDLFTFSINGIAVYRNDSDPALQFTRIPGEISIDSNNLRFPIPLIPIDIPALSDTDDDGDLDILVFGSSGFGTANSVVHFRNLSMDLYNNCDSLVFEVGSQCWGNFQESSSTNTITFNACKRSGGSAHSGSSLLVEDFTGDGPKDVLIGDISFPNMVFLTNSGGFQTASMLQQDTTYPDYDVPVDLILFPAAYFVDVDNDNIRDLLVAPNISDGGENLNNVHFYKNDGADNNPDFAFTNSRFLSEEMIEVGGNAIPVIAPLDTDNLADLLIGNLGMLDIGGVHISSLSFFKNVGTATNPAFELETNDFANFSQLGLSALHPTVGDLDGDGDLDLICGESQGTLLYFINNSSSGNAFNPVLSDPAFGGIDVGLFSAPQLVDVNRDGVLDLLVGNRKGTLDYYENTGTTAAPQFSGTPTVAKFGNVDTDTQGLDGFSKPWLTKLLDDTDDYYLMVGAENGRTVVYGNIDNNLSGTFDRIDSLDVPQGHTAVAGADLNQDGKIEFIIGERAGGVMLYREVFDIPLSTSELAQVKLNWEMYPNPAGGELKVRWESSTRNGAIKITDLLGKVVMQHQMNGFNGLHTLDLSQLQAGFFLVEFSDDGLRESKKLLKY